MNGGIPVTAMILPLIAPASSPTPSPIATGIHTGKSVRLGNTAREKSEVCAKLAAIIADNANTEPEDKSMPVIIFLVVAVIFHIALRYTKYGKYTYAIGGNMQAARTSGINVKRHLIIVYSIAGLLAGLAGVVASARAATGQAGMGMSYELDAIAAAVIGGTSLAGGVGRITGTVIGALILGVMASGFTFVGVDAYIQDIIKGLIIVIAVVIDQYRNKRKLKR